MASSHRIGSRELIVTPSEGHERVASRGRNNRSIRGFSRSQRRLGAPGSTRRVRIGRMGSDSPDKRFLVNADPNDPTHPSYPNPNSWGSSAKPQVGIAPTTRAEVTRLVASRRCNQSFPNPIRCDPPCFARGAIRPFQPVSAKIRVTRRSALHTRNPGGLDYRRDEAETDRRSSRNRQQPNLTPELVRHARQVPRNDPRSAVDPHR